MTFADSNECGAMRAMVHAILGNAQMYRWTVQGFGMLRTYLPAPENEKRFRLNMWNSALAVPHVSVIHDHPWSFDSWIINGQFRNRRLVDDYFNGTPYHWMVIKTGEGGGPSRQRLTIGLRELPVEKYNTGDKYHQDAHEIHLSDYDDGTVTLNDRVGDTEHARVFWPVGEDWVDAKPREATAEEIDATVKLALGKWDGVKHEDR